MKKTQRSLGPPGPRSTNGVLGFHRISRSLRAAGLPRDLTWERLSALSVIAENEPVSISELSAAEKVTLPTMSRMVSALESRELVRCVLDDEDKRSVLVVSTAKGRATLRKGLNHSLTLIASLLESLEQEALEAMTELIRTSRGERTDERSTESSNAHSD